MWFIHAAGCIDEIKRIKIVFQQFDENSKYTHGKWTQKKEDEMLPQKTKTL